MFHIIPKQVQDRMSYLEAIDAKDRDDGTERLKRLRQITPDTGKFIALLASIAPAGNLIEIGTSAGYSALWISLACIEKETKITTFEILDEKYNLAQETFSAANVSNYINLIKGDACRLLKDIDDVSFCFLDAEKEIYDKLYDIVIPKMVTGGILVADNAINHRETLQPMLDKALDDERIDALIVPIGKGELVCRKL